LSLMTSRRSGLRASVSFVRIALSSDIAIGLISKDDLSTVYGSPATAARGAGRAACARQQARSYSDSMKLDSKFFDMIRIHRPPTAEGEADKGACCQWQGCLQRGRHRAPKGRGRDGEFFLFCADHVRQYNSAYNYFEGMSDTEVADYQSGAAYGH